MRDSLGVLLMEEADGSIAVQLFADPVKSKESFDNMKGKLGQAPQRATFLSLAYEDKPEGVKLVLKDFVAKNLPVPEVPASERPDAWRLGEGPIKLEEKNES